MTSPQLFAYADLIISNAKSPTWGPVRVSALADTGANFLCIPDHIAVQLGIDEHGSGEFKEVTLADGSHRKVPYVGPLQLQFKNRTCYTGALVMGDEVLLGITPMADMDLVVFAEERRVDINPENPNLGAAKAKRMKVKSL